MFAEVTKSMLNIGELLNLQRTLTFILVSKQLGVLYGLSADDRICVHVAGVV
jgi:hypothetical protein